MSESDGAEAGHIGVDAIAEALGFLEQIKSCGTQMHIVCPPQKRKATCRKIAAVGGLFLEASRVGEIICKLNGLIYGLG
jgi:hypothetical protein